MKISIPIESLRRFRKQVFSQYKSQAALQHFLTKELENGKGKSLSRLPWDLELIQTEGGSYIFN